MKDTRLAETADREMERLEEELFETYGDDPDAAKKVNFVKQVVAET